MAVPNYPTRTEALSRFQDLQAQILQAATTRRNQSAQGPIPRSIALRFFENVGNKINEIESLVGSVTVSAIDAQATAEYGVLTPTYTQRLQDIVTAAHACLNWIHTQGGADGFSERQTDIATRTLIQKEFSTVSAAPLRALMDTLITECTWSP